MCVLSVTSIGFEHTIYSVMESDGSVKVCFVVRSVGDTCPQNISATISTSGLTAGMKPPSLINTAAPVFLMIIC